MKNRPRRMVWIGRVLGLALSCMPFSGALGQSASVRSQTDLIGKADGYFVETPQAAFVLKTSPSARALLAYSAAGKKDIARPLLSPDRYAVFQDRAGRWFADLLVQTTSPEALQALGADVLFSAGRVAAVRMALEDMPGLVESPAVAYVDIARKSKPLGLSGAPVGSLAAPAGYRGEDVLVGLVDTGIDFTHPDLMDSTGTRILYLWDMSDVDNTDAPTDVDPAFDWGRQYDKAVIDADPRQVIQRDGDGGGGHGTHVAGIAAGNGALNRDNRGVAPSANLIVVKAVRSVESGGGFSDADVLVACRYIFTRAEALGKPAVINLSLGHYDGPLDGSSLFEEALSELAGPGRILVAAAGNGGFSPIHAGGRAEENGTYEVFLEPSQSDRAGVNLWYEAGSVQTVSVGFYSRQGGDPVLIGATDEILVGQTLGVGNPAPVLFNGSTLGYLTVDAATTVDARNGDGHIRIAWTNDDNPGVDLSRTLWSVRTKSAAAGRQDMWAIDAVFVEDAVAAAVGEQWIGDSEHSIASPATANRVIAVGSYVGANRFVNVLGRERAWENPTRDGGVVVPDIGQRSYFSGVGPTRDGRMLPHLSAPGEVIVSLLSSHLTPGKGYAIDAVQDGGHYLAMEGTSVAAAHVTGTVASMLSVHPELSHDLALRILQETANVDLQTGAARNGRFGAGKLDAPAAIGFAEALAGGSAAASLDVDRLAGHAPPGVPIAGQFTLQNSGAVDLTFDISLDEPSLQAASNKASLSTLRSAAVDRAPRPVLAIQDNEPAGGSMRKGNAHEVIQGRDVLMHDDGNHIPDQFWGTGDGSETFFWGNHFILDDFDFTLEKVQFYARTEEVSQTEFWIGIYKSPFILNLFAGQRVTLATNPDGAWYEVELNTPLSFARGAGMFIEISAPQSILLPAGVDAASATVGRSYFAELGNRYENLTTETSSGVEKGAFLVRAVGTATRNVNLPPVASAVVSSFTGVEREEIGFDASPSSDPDGEIVSYFWDFGDGSTSNEKAANHTYTTRGTYAVSLSVTDDQGAVSRAEGEIQVVAEGTSTGRLSVSPRQGLLVPGASQVFDVQYDTESLDNGIYEGHIEIASNAGFLDVSVRYDVNIAYVSTEDEPVAPAAFRLEKNYPNPFNPETVIAYEIPAAYRVMLEVYDATGRRVRVLENGAKPAGRYEVIWDATDDSGARAASGVYFYRLSVHAETGSSFEQKMGKMVLTK